MPIKTIALTFALICLIGNSGDASPKSFQMRLIADPETFDWTLAHTPTETPVVMNTMEGLVAFDKNMKVIPALATSWTISADQKTYTFHLRNVVRW